MAAGTILQMPQGKAEQLLLLFHGVCSTPESMAGIGRRLAAEMPQAAIISVPGRQAGDGGRGFQWFSVGGVTEENRPARIAEAMPHFIAAVRGWQQQTGVAPQATALIGFSQGAIMSLEATQRPDEPLLCARVAALSGRFANDPEIAPEQTTLHFVHGKEDAVIHYGHTVRAAERLVRLGGDVTADVIPFLAHQITEEVESLVLDRLRNYLPQRVWREALRSDPEDQA